MRQRNGANDHNLKLPYRQIPRARATTAKALRTLEAAGLIDIVQRGGLFRSCSVYRLSERWKQPHMPPTTAAAQLRGTDGKAL